MRQKTLEVYGEENFFLDLKLSGEERKHTGNSNDQLKAKIQEANGVPQTETGQEVLASLPVEALFLKRHRHEQAGQWRQPKQTGLNLDSAAPFTSCVMHIWAGLPVLHVLIYKTSSGIPTQASQLGCKRDSGSPRPVPPSCIWDATDAEIPSGGAFRLGQA